MKPLFCILLSTFFCKTVCSQVRPELVLPVTHSSSINIIRYSYNNQYLLTGSEDKTAKVWEVSSGKLLHDLKGHTGGIVAASFSPDNAYVLTVASAGAVGATDKSARLWKISTGELVQTYDHTDHIYDGSFSHHGKWVATCSEDRTAKIWEAISGKLLFTLDPEGSNVDRIAFSPDDKIIATISYKNIGLWESSTGKLLRNIKTDAKDIGFTPEGKLLISTEKYFTHTINVWDVATGTLKNSLKTKGEPVKRFAISNDGKWLATSDFYKTMIWDMASPYLPYKVLDEGSSATFDKTSTMVMAASVENLIKVYNLKTGAVVNSFKGDFNSSSGTFVPSTQSNLVSNDNKYLACSQGYDISLVNYTTGEIYKKIQKHTSAVGTVAVSVKGNYVAILKDRKVVVIDGNTGKLINTLQTKEDYSIIADLKFSHDESKLFVFDNNKVYMFEPLSGKLITTFIAHERRATIPYSTVSPDDKILITICNGLKGWDIASGTMLYSVPGDFALSKGASFSRDGKLVGIAAYTQLLILDAATGKTVKTMNNKNRMEFVDCSLSPDGKYVLAAISYEEALIYDMETGNYIRRLPHTSKLTSATFSPGGKSIITTTETGEALVWDAADAVRAVAEPWKDSSAKVIGRFGLEKNTYRYKTSFCFEKNWMVINANNEVAFYDLQTRKKTLGWVGIDEEDYVVYLPNNYYTATPNAARWVNWKIGNTLYDFDQWDIKYNRPDIILKAFQNKDTALINAYRSAYHKRLKKLDLDSNMFQDDYKVPEMIMPASYPATVTQSNQLKLKISAKETIANTYLRKIYVTVNGNPVYGKNGYNIPKKNATEASLEVILPLNTGANQVKISCLNNRGAESLRKKININYEPAQKPVPKLWYVGIGVSKYKNEKYDLTYAAKDINDVSALLKSKYSSYQPILLLNEQATLENIKAINQRLVKETSPDDMVIISLSGHGLVDKEFNFFFATHDIDFDSPASRGLSMDNIEILLDKVVASKKLVLMDACHSGELDADESVIGSTTAEDKNVKVGTKGGIVISKKSGLNTKSSFELLQELFSSTNASNGATVISAAGGNEFAYEGQSWNNGVFTYCILSALKEKKGDADKSGGLTVSELQKQVSREVKELTGGKQKPTSRQVNYENDWIIWQ